MVMLVFGEYFQVQIALEKKQTPWDMKSTTTTFCSTQTKLIGDACLYVQIDVKYPSAQWIIVLVTFQ